MLRLVLLLLLSLTLISEPALAAGLIYRLPEDGSWARFRGQLQIRDFKSIDGKPLSPGKATFNYALILRSVGTQDTIEGRGRWIEIESNAPPKEEYPGRIIVLKMLIPEKYLTADEDPLNHVQEAYFRSRNWEYGVEPEVGNKEKLTDRDRLQYELERFRTQFPYPNSKQCLTVTSRGQTVDTPLGRLTVTKVAFPMQFSGRLSGGKGPRWKWSGNLTLWLTEDSPFGVSALQNEFIQIDETQNADESKPISVGVQSKNTLRIELESVGAKAKSELPEFPPSLR